MARGMRYQPEQVVNLLRHIEVAVANGKTTAQACKEAEIVEQTYFRLRKEYGGLQIDQAQQLKELEQENGNPIVEVLLKAGVRRILVGLLTSILPKPYY
jgi:putative transposase